MRASDRARADYLRRYHDVDWLDPTHYHLVLNTASLPAPTAVQLIIAAEHAVDLAGDSADVGEGSDA